MRKILFIVFSLLLISSISSADARRVIARRNASGGGCPTGLVAWWKFDNGALTTDSQGTNTLTNNNSIAANTTTYKQGDASADLENYPTPQSQYFSILDSSLDSGFPLKNDDTGTFSVTLWYYCESVSGIHYKGLFSKQDYSSANQLMIRDDNGTLQVYIGWQTGSSGLELLHSSSAFSAGNWYHIGFTFNNSTKAWKLVAWNDTSSTKVIDTSSTASHNMAMTTAILTIGNWYTGGAPSATFLDGLIDDTRVYDTILTTDEIDAIRAGSCN